MNTSLIKRSWLLPVAAGLLVWAAPSATTAAPLKEGSPFPELGTFSLEGKLPDSIQGKVVLVDFWASWCGPCKASFPVLEELHKKYAAQGLVVLGINVDDKRGAMDDFLAKHRVSFPVVRDQKKELVKKASISTMPTSFLLDGEGKIRYVHSGFHGADSEKKYVTEIEELLKSLAVTK